ncbi:MAG: polyprenyl synthetase family protein [Coriobacteriales bacterium]|nr:polyprenyl synthetase family protein [Coriobacteriales bacterium]
MNSSLFEKYLKDNIFSTNIEFCSYYKEIENDDINRYLYTPLLHHASNGGKRHRPLACILACLAVGGDPNNAKGVAYAIEHFHTAALLHDDIEDNAKTRRNKPCFHVVDGVPLAINAGDYSLTITSSTIIDDPHLTDTQKVFCVSEVSKMSRATIEGQALDIGWSRDERYDLTIQDYVLMARLKTAYYSGAVPLALGAYVGGGTHEQIEAFRTYGLDCGLAFQIQDDLLNLVGEKESKDKDFRLDITEGKRTLIVLHALSCATDEDKAELLKILKAHTDDEALLARAVDIMQRCGSIDFARQYAINLSEKSINLIKSTIPDSKYRKILLSMASYFVQRIS